MGTSGIQSWLLVLQLMLAMWLQAQAQHEAIWTALEGKLPTELPVRDEGAEGQANIDNAPADADLQVLNEDDLVKSLVGLPWEFIINKAARQEWAGMNRQFR